MVTAGVENQEVNKMYGGYKTRGALIRENLQSKAPIHSDQELTSQSPVVNSLCIPCTKLSVYHHVW